MVLGVLSATLRSLGLPLWKMGIVQPPGTQTCRQKGSGKALLLPQTPGGGAGGGEGSGLRKGGLGVAKGAEQRSR